MISTLAAVVLHPAWGHAHWWPVFPLLWLVLWAAIIVTAIVLWRRRRNHPTRSAQSVVAEEFARGNITEEDYEQRLTVLRRHDRG